MAAHRPRGAAEDQADPREPSEPGPNLNPVGPGNASAAAAWPSEAGAPLGFHTNESAYRDIFVFERRLHQLQRANQRKLRMGECVLFAAVFTMAVTGISMLAPAGGLRAAAAAGRPPPTTFTPWARLIWDHVASLALLLLQVPHFFSSIFSLNHVFSPFAVFLFAALSLLSFVTTRSYFYLIVLPSRWHRGLNRTLRSFNMELSASGTLLFTTRIPPDFVRGYEGYRQKRLELEAAPAPSRPVRSGRSVSRAPLVRRLLRYVTVQ